MYIVYVLKDERGKMYKGMTSNLKRRLLEHKRGNTKSTRYLENPSVVYTKEHPSFEKAREREVYFKTAAGRRFLKSKIQK
jgi:putative endonuclease